MSVTDESVQVEETGGSDTMRGGATLDSVLDVPSLQAEIERNARINRATCRPYRQYIKRVIEKAGLQNVQAVRELGSNICGAVARLPFVPDDKDVVEVRSVGGKRTEITEFDLQVERTAQMAEVQLGSEMVWTTAARRLAKAALELRRTDPDGSRCKATDGKEGAWVNPLGADDASVLDQ